MLPAGPPGAYQWRVAEDDLDAYIERLRAETEAWIDSHPFTAGEEDEPMP